MVQHLAKRFAVLVIILFSALNVALADEAALRAALAKFSEGEGFAAIERVSRHWVPQVIRQRRRH